MKNNAQAKIIIEFFPKILILLTAFLLPLFFLPVTIEYFEFNKLILLILITVLLLIFGGLRILVIQKFEITKSQIDFPIGIFTTLMIISTIFSIHKATSIYGSEGRWFPSLLGFSTIVIFYYIASVSIKNLKILRSILYTIILAVTVNSIVAILSYFKIYLGEFEYLKSANFTLTGSGTTSSLLAVIILYMSASLLTNTKATQTKLLLLSAMLVNAFQILILGVIQSLILLVVGLLVFLFFTSIEKLKENQFELLLALGSILATAVIAFHPATKQIIKNKEYQYEVILPFKESWINASSAMRDFPLVGSGPSTFYLNFNRYKTLAFNSTPLWNTRFDKPYNEVFNIIGTLGIFGILAAIFFGVRALRIAFMLKNDDLNMTNSVSAAIGIGVILSLFVYLVTYATVLNTFLLFMLLAVAVAKLNINNKAETEDILVSIESITSTSNSTHIKYVMSLPFFIIAVLATYLVYRLYAGEYYLKLSLYWTQLNEGGKAYTYQGNAISMNPSFDSYQVLYAQTNIAIANVLASRQDLTDQDKQNIQTLIAQAIRSVRIATEVLNPINVTDWEIRANVYRALIGVADNADQWAINSYETVKQLDPTNPRIRLNVGAIYYSKQDYLSAANEFKQAALLKPDYANAYFNLAESLVQLKDYENAKRAFQATQRLLPQDSQDSQIVAQEITKLEQLPGVAGAKTSKPTVEEISQQTNQQKPAPQEPLTTPTQ